MPTPWARGRHPDRATARVRHAAHPLWGRARQKPLTNQRVWRFLPRERQKSQGAASGHWWRCSLDSPAQLEGEPSRPPLAPVLWPPWIRLACKCKKKARVCAGSLSSPLPCCPCAPSLLGSSQKFRSGLSLPPCLLGFFFASASSSKKILFGCCVSLTTMGRKPTEMRSRVDAGR